MVDKNLNWNILMIDQAVWTNSYICYLPGSQRYFEMTHLTSILDIEFLRPRTREKLL